MAKISSLSARQVLDSRGVPTIEAEVILDTKARGVFITPSGASCGKKEALELRDNDPKAFFGRGVKKAIAHVENEIRDAILHREFLEQQELDHLLIELDGTENKARLGANAILSVSGAFFHAMAALREKPLYASGQVREEYVLPMPMINVLNGGVHANNGLDIQEFMIVPVGAQTFSQAIKMAAETFYALKDVLKKSGLSTAVGDEGGFAPALKNNEQALELLISATQRAGLKPHEDISYALDVAASELYDPKNQCYRLDSRLLSREEMLVWYKSMVERFPICSVEDPFHEDDLMGFKQITNELSEKVQIVGDDVFVTNEKYIRDGIENGYANAVLIKMNQIGTITETLASIRLTMEHGFHAIVSHRSGDSEDTTIADLSVMMATGQIKTGSLSRSERCAKYNRLLKIEKDLGSKASFKSFHR